MLSLRAIVPKKIVLAKYPDSSIGAGLRLYALDLTNEMKSYPPYQPTKTRYKRTGNLGRRWGYSYTSSKATVDNDRYYARYVQGYVGRSPRQTALMASRGWQSVSEKGREVWQRHLPDIQQRLARGA